MNTSAARACAPVVPPSASPSPTTSPPANFIMLADMCRLDQSLLGIRSYGPERLLWSRQFNHPSVSNWPVSDRRRRRPARILPKPRSVQPFLERHPPLYQDIGLCSRAWYGRGATVLPSDSLSVGKSVWPSSAVAYGYHGLKDPIPTEEPRNPQSGHTDELTGAVMRGYGLEKDSPLLSVWKG